LIVVRWSSILPQLSWVVIDIYERMLNTKGINSICLCNSEVLGVEVFEEGAEDRSMEMPEHTFHI